VESYGKLLVVDFEIFATQEQEERESVTNVAVLEKNSFGRNTA